VADSKREDTSFKVIDRRLFSETGEIRPEVVEQERRDDEAAAKKAASKAQESSSQAGGSAAGAGAAAGARTKSFGSPGTLAEAQNAVPQGFDPQPMPHGAPNDLVGADPVAEASPSSRSFQMLVDFLTRNAVAMLGGMADPRTGQAFVDLEGAREVIDMLDALRDKTRGNLSKEDDNLLIEVLGSLKLTFMEMSKAAAEQMAKKAKGK
jgi:Domain of unknown function (DUF1844)